MENEKVFGMKRLLYEVFSSGQREVGLKQTTSHLEFPVTLHPFGTYFKQTTVLIDLLSLFIFLL